MSNSRERMRAIFDQARRLPRPERGAFLDGLAAVDGLMRSQIEDMLAALDDAGAFLSEPTGHLANNAGPIDPITPTLLAPVREGPGTHIGPYKILQVIGEGGFGTVFMAEQAKPVQRKVALKIIKLGMDTRQVVARFEQERQALAMMDHPSIAKVFDAGATDTGRPYFVMELVKGDPIVEYCDKHNLTIQERLNLFVQVCNAVQHAHTKGIIHRDIKPSNILVSTQDDRPSAKVIDFGIAKATASKLTEKTLFTEHRTLIGTPEYMSPEQAEGNLDIDTRTDVYSLGVLLYELLTGTTPFSSQELRSAAYAEIQRIIREVEPPKPSTRLSNNTDSIASVAAHRHTEPERLGTLIRGELDWIVMKALEKDRQRRYETATDLGADIRRYLTGDAIHAAPPSTGYRVRKFIVRHRAGVVFASAVTAALVVGLVGTSMGLTWALHEKDRADASARAADAAKIEAQDRTKDLEKAVSFQASQLSGIDVMQMGIRFRQDLLDGVRQAADKSQAPRDKTEANLATLDGVLSTVDLTGIARSALENGIFTPSIAAIHREFAEQPRVRADLLVSVSESARRLGSFAVADQPGREAIDIHSAHSGPLSEKTLRARMRHALLLKDQGQLQAAESQMRDLLAATLAEHGENSRLTVDVRANFATVLAAQTKFAECEELYRVCLAWYQEHADPGDPDTAGCMGSYAQTLTSLGKLDEAEPLLIGSVEGCRAAYGENNQRTIQSLNGLAGFYRTKQNHEKALEVYHGALETSRKSLGEYHWLTLMLTDNIGGVKFLQGDRESAATFARAALDGRARTLGDRHPATLRSCYNLARVLDGHGNGDDVIGLYRRALDGFRVVYGEFHAHTIAGRNSLSGALLNAGRFAECRDLLEGEVELIGQQSAPADRRRAVVRALGILYEKWDAAEPGQGHGAKAAEWKTTLDAMPPEPAKGPK